MIFLMPLGAETGQVLAMRLTLLREGRDPRFILPSDLNRFGIGRWDGTFFGMSCVGSPVVVVDR